MKYFYLSIFLLLLLSCTTQPNVELQEMPISIDLTPAMATFDITRVKVTITKDEFIDSIDLDIFDNSAIGTFYDLEPGIYEIIVEVFEGETMIAIGSGTGEVIAGETTIVEIILEYVELTGNLEIHVEWEIIDFPERILFIGNSITYYNGGLDSQFQQLVLSAHPEAEIVCESITAGGATLEQHWNNPSTQLAIIDGNYDIVVLQERTSWPVDFPEIFYEYATLFDSLIVESGAETVLFFSQPYRGVFDTMIEEQAVAFNYISSQLGAKVVPAGRAWQLSRAQDILLELFNDDGNHPNVFGSYLTACTFYAYFWEESPVGIEYVNDEMITEEKKLFLQNIAWQTFGIY